MKIQTLFVPLAVAAVVGLGAHSLGAAPQQGGQKPTTGTTAPAQGGQKPTAGTAAQPAAPKTHTIEGEFVSMDPKAHTIAFKDAAGKTVNAPLQAKAEKEVDGLKPGDRVRLTCQDGAKGEHQAITSVQRAAAPPAKR